MSLYRRPSAASLSSVGILHGPPKALDCPKPISSSKTTTTFGAPFGAFTSNRGGGLTLRASSSVIIGGLGSGNGSKLDAATSKCITAEFLITISDFIVIGLAFQFHLLSQNIR